MEITKQEILEYIRLTAREARKAGMTVDINTSLPYVAVNTLDGEGWFFQGEEAEALLSDMPENVEDDDYILWLSQGW